MLLCPWYFPGKNTGVGCRFLLQRIFPIQGSNLHLLQDFPGGSDSKEFAYSAGDLGLIPGWEDPLEKETATHSSILA